MQASKFFLHSFEQTVSFALAEDIGTGDISAALIPGDAAATAVVISREDAVLCGRQWVDEVFRQVDAGINVDWYCADGEAIAPDQPLLVATGPARELLTAERTALNFLQLLSGTATRAASFARLVADLPVKLLDTRKTLPGLRLAQKYAVTCGGCHNHRIGLYDAYLIKENHIAACGGITAAVTRARELQPGMPVEVEVETFGEFREALDAGADIIMLDNFSPHAMTEAVAHNAGRAKLEASGGVNRENLRTIAATGVDYISIGSLTRDLQSVDLSMRFQMREA